MTRAADHGCMVNEMLHGLMMATLAIAGAGVMARVAIGCLFR